MTRRNQKELANRDTWWSRRPAYVRDLICLALLLALAIAYYVPVLVGGQAIYGSDTIHWRSGAEAMIQYRDATGEEPLWAPNMFGGMPGYLISFPTKVPQFDTFMSWLREIAWPASHLFLLLVGMYWLVTYLTRNRLAALLSAVAFGMTTYIPIIISVGHNTKFIALAYAPYLLLAFVYTLRNPSLLGGLLFAGALGLELRAGHPQITYYVLFLIGIWWIVEMVGSIRRSEWKPIGQATGWLALGTVLGLLMVAQPYLSIYEYKQYTVRGSVSPVAMEGEGNSGGMAWSNAMMWSQGPGEMVTFLIAHAYGGGGSSYWGPKPGTAGPHYLGGLILFLAFLAIWRIRTNTVWALGIGAGLMSLFALGKHAAWINRPMFELFPFFDAFRAPETWLIVVALALSVLGGYGLAYLFGADSPEDSPDERTRSMWIVGGSVLTLVAVLWMGSDVFFSFQKEGELQRYTRYIAQQNQVSPDNPQVRAAAQRALDQVQQQRQEQFADDAFRTLLVLLASLAALGLYRYEKIPAWAAGLVVVTILTIDLWGVARRYLGEDQFEPETKLVQQIPEYGFDRFIKARVEEAGGPGHFRALPLALNPMSWAQSSYHYESTGGYHGAKLQLYQDYIDHILFPQGRLQPNENALDLLSTRYIIARRPLPGTEVVYRDEATGLLVLENLDALPRAFFVGQIEVIESAQQIWQRLRDPSFNLRQTAILPKPIEFNTTPIDSGSTARVTLEKFTPPEIVWHVQTDAPRLMVASEVYYPAGWNAYVDGEEVPIYRADYLLRAVPVPAGEHTVTMRFEPASYRVGLFLSWASTTFVYFGVLLILGLGWYRRREEEAAVTSDIKA